MKILNDEEIEKAKGLFLPPSVEEWAIKPDHRYWNDKRLAQAAHDNAVRQMIEKVEAILHSPIADGVDKLLSITQLLHNLKEELGLPPMISEQIENEIKGEG